MPPVPMEDPLAPLLVEREGVRSRGMECEREGFLAMEDYREGIGSESEEGVGGIRLEGVGACVAVRRGGAAAGGVDELGVRLPPPKRDLWRQLL